MVVNFGNISTKFCRLEAPGGREQSLFAPSLSSRSWWSWKCGVWGEGVKLCEQEPPIPHLLISWSPDPEVIVLTCVNRSLLSSISWSPVDHESVECEVMVLSCLTGASYPDHDESVECEVMVLTGASYPASGGASLEELAGNAARLASTHHSRVQPPPIWWIQSHHSIIFASPVPL